MNKYIVHYIYSENDYEGGFEVYAYNIDQAEDIFEQRYDSSYKIDWIEEVYNDKS